MDLLENFSGSDKREGLSESAYEAFQEKMKKAAKEMSASKKEEKKHKKKEEDLYKILLIFIQNSKNDTLLKLISECLELNIPSGFILSIIQLGNNNLSSLIKVNLEKNKSIIFFNEDRSLSPELRMELDLWVKSQLFYAEEYKLKLLKNAVNEATQQVKEPIINLHCYMIFDFIKNHNIEMAEDKIEKLSRFIIAGIFEKIKPKQINSD